MLVLIIVLLFIIVFILFFVHRGATLTAQEALANYLQAVRGGRTEEAYRYLSSAAKANQTREDYRAANSLGNGLIAQAIGGKISFVVENIDVMGDRATATVAMTSPDFPLMIRDIFRNLSPAVIPGQTMEALTFVCRQISIFLDKYQGEGLPMRTARETFSLLRESDGWKIDSLPLDNSNRNPSPSSS
jgi:hypothetical protein